MSEMNENKTWSRIWGIDPNYTVDRDARKKVRAMAIMEQHRLGAMKFPDEEFREVACMCSGEWRTWKDYYEHLAEMFATEFEE